MTPNQLCQLSPLYCHFNKIIKEPGTNFQSPTFELFWTCQKYLSYSTLVFDQISFKQYLGFKRNNDRCNFHYVAIPMVMSQILKSVDFTKTQKSR